MLNAFHLPEWVCDPDERNRKSVLKAYKNGKLMEEYSVGGKSIYLLGRDKESNDIHLANPSISRNHAAIVHDAKGGIYLIDLMSRHGTFVEKVKIPPHHPTLLHVGQVIAFGQSERKYKLDLVDEQVASGKVVKKKKKKLWKLRGLNKTAGGEKKDSKVKVDSVHLKMVNGMCVKGFEGYRGEVKEMKESDVQQIVHGLVDKLKVKFGLTKLTVQKNALKVIVDMVKDGRGIEYVEERIQDIAMVSQGTKETENRTLAREILQLLAVQKLASDSDNSGEEQSLYVPPGVPSPKYQSVRRKNTVVEHVAQQDAKVQSPYQHHRVSELQRRRVLSDEGKRIFVQAQNSGSERGSFCDEAEEIEQYVNGHDPIDRYSNSKGYASRSPEDDTRIDSPQMGPPSRDQDDHMSHEEYVSPMHGTNNTEYHSSSNDHTGYANEGYESNDSEYSQDTPFGSDSNHSSLQPSGSISEGSTQASGFQFMSEATETEEVTSAFGFMSATASEVDSDEDDQYSIPNEFLRDAESVEFDPTSFEHEWDHCKDSIDWKAELNCQFEAGQLEQLLAEYNIHCLASGAVGSITKSYYYAQQQTGNTVFMAEINVAATIYHIQATFKWLDTGLIYDNTHETFIQMIQQIVRPYVVVEPKIEDMLAFTPNPYIDPANFEGMWSESDELDVLHHELEDTVGLEDLEPMFLERDIACLASGLVGSIHKFYFYGILNKNATLVLFQVDMDLDEYTVQTIVKCHSPLKKSIRRTVLQVIRETLDLALN